MVCKKIIEINRFVVPVVIPAWVEGATGNPPRLPEE
jgi:hypothetical protein